MQTDMTPLQAMMEKALGLSVEVVAVRKLDNEYLRCYLNDRELGIFCDIAWDDAGRQLWEGFHKPGHVMYMPMPPDEALGWDDPEAFRPEL